MIDRKKLREIIFQTPTEKKWLEALLHPLIREEIQRQVKQVKSPYTLIDIPLLINRADYSYLNRILVVDCSKSLQIERVIQRDNISKEAALNIIQAQISREERLVLADDIILNNTNNLNDLDAQVEKLHQQYLYLSK